MLQEKDGEAEEKKTKSFMVIIAFPLTKGEDATALQKNVRRRTFSLFLPARCQALGIFC